MHLGRRKLQRRRNQLEHAQNDHDSGDHGVHDGHQSFRQVRVEEDSEENGRQRLADGREKTPLHGLPLAARAVVERQRDGDAFGDVVDGDGERHHEASAGALREVLEEVGEREGGGGRELADADDGGVEDDEAFGEVVERDSESGDEACHAKGA